MRTKCDECGANRGKGVYSSGTYCFACYHKTSTRSLIELPRQESVLFLDLKDSVEHIPKTVKDWLHAYYVTSEDIKCNVILWNTQLQRLIFFVVLKSYTDSAWARSINPNVRNKWLFLGNKKKKYYYVKCRTRQLKHQLYIVEDPISAIRLSKYVDCFALCGTATNFEGLVSLITQYKELVVWLDGDSAGRLGAEKFKKKYSLVRPVKIVRTLSDPKAHTPTEMEEIIMKYRIENTMGMINE